MSTAADRTPRWRAIFSAIGLTAGGWVACALAIVALAVGLWLKISGLVLLAAALGALIILVWLSSWRAPRLQVTRTNLPARVRLGRQVEAKLQVEAARARSQVTLIETFESSHWPALSVTLCNLQAGKPQTVTYSFPADRRGTYRVGPTWVQWQDPFALTRRKRIVAQASEVMVHPVTESLADLISSRAFEDPNLRPPQSRPWPTGAEFYGWREYQPGDDVRQLNWRALAQHDTYLVREAEHGITSHTWVVLDTAGVSYGADLATTPDALLPTFECAVRAAASVALSHLRTDQAVTIHTGEHTQTLNRGVQGEFELLDQLARLQVGQHRAAETLWELVRSKLFGHMVFITGNLTPDVVNLLAVLASQQVSLTVVVATGETTSPLTWDLLTSLRARVVIAEVDQPLGRSFARVLGGGQ